MKALVVGGDSLIGSALSQHLRQRGDGVIATSRRRGAARPAPEDWMTLDLAAPLPQSLPGCDVAFFCAALTGFAACREAPQLAERVNVLAPAELAGRLVRAGTRVVLLSTSAVLDCREPHMRADRPYSPRGAYGVQKAAAEVAFRALGTQACILRLTKVLARGDPRVRQWSEALREQRPIVAFDDHRFSPLGVEHVVLALVAIAQGGEGGIYQVSGRDDVSYAELAHELARRLAVSGDCVRSCHAASAGIPEDEVTPYTSLDTSRLTALSGFVPPPANAVLDRVLA